MCVQAAASNSLEGALDIEAGKVKKTVDRTVQGSPNRLKLRDAEQQRGA